MSWEHPQMPWEHTRIHIAPLGEDGRPTDPQVVLGGDRALLEPQWDRDGSLYFIDERSGWWNLYAWDGRPRRRGSTSRCARR